MGSAPAVTPRAAEICVTCICSARWSNRDDESILFKLSEDERDKVIVAYAMLPLKDDDRPVDSWRGWLPVEPINSWTGDSPTRVGYEAANGAAMNIATVKTNNASIRDVRRYDESILRMMRVEGTWSSQGLFVIVAHNLTWTAEKPAGYLIRWARCAGLMSFIDRLQGVWNSSVFNTSNT